MARRREIPALKVHQWLADWDKVKTDKRAHQAPPPHHFYCFSMPAAELRILSGILRRTANPDAPRAADVGIQRRHDRERSDEIREFVRFGYPWSSLSKTKRESGEYGDLRKPGWLPTAIVVNILTPEDKRPGGKVDSEDLVTVKDTEGALATISVPAAPHWKPTRLFPLEVIDGQHRLWAFEGEQPGGRYEVPVVAFHGLDVSWQAYLFWTINIKPKRINASLAFDLYPLLRAEDWLNKAEGLAVYRETRAQELTEAMWAHPDSPWYARINMLGETGGPAVSQAAWIRSLMATCVRPWDNPRSKLGGLFGAPMGEDEEVLPWTRAQQAAFLIHAWRALADAIRKSRAPWARDLREGDKVPEKDPAFEGPHTLLNNDQGVRGYLHVANDICYVRAEELNLRNWPATVEDAGAVDSPAVSRELASLKNLAAAKLLEAIAADLATYDWRASSAPDLDENDRVLKLVFRGSSGYKELRKQLLSHLADQNVEVRKVAKELLKEIG